MQINNLSMYDRQNRTYGIDATKSLTTSTVVVIGLSGGLATETCKNLILSGVMNIILIECNIIQKSDITTGFYFYDEDINMKRHIVLASKLSELNPYCNIITSTIDSLDFTNKIIILHNGTKDNAVYINNKCRNVGAKFIWSISKGMAGFIFVDANINHVITDTMGETIEPVQIANISKDGIVECAQNNSHDFMDGDTITFTNVVGINVSFLEKEWIVTVYNKFKFKLNNFISDDFNFINGTANHIKKSTIINHNSLSDQLYDTNDDILNSLLDSKDIPNSCWSDIMNRYVSQYEDKNVQKIVRSFPLDVMPVVSIIGSYTAMETIKLITNKFIPISQWFIYSDSEIIPDKKPDNISDSGLGMLFGTDIELAIKKSDWLMVGCGAIGCEMLKNLAKLNFSTDKGTLFVTDPDHIEKTNLSRQFLFRNNHIGCSKSKIAIESIKTMNKNINCIALEKKMSVENQDMVNMMLPKLTGVINALDNIEARLYMDEQCFRYNIPLFESGTQGMKGNTQPVIPFITETYSNSSDPPQEKSFPVCTIKNFPNKPEHVIHWAMDYFDIFRRGPENVLKYLTEGDAFINSLSGYDKNIAREDIFKYCVKYNPLSWKDCSFWASNIFCELYRDNIMQLLDSFPKDSMTPEGEYFWSKGKRCPNIIDYDLSNKLVVDFLESTTHLLTRVCCLDDTFNRNELVECLTEYKPYVFMIDKNKKMASNDKEIINQENKNVDISIPKSTDIKLHFNKMNIQEFEKDNDSNWHISFITAASNLRATNYEIPTSTYEETKGISGKIIPAVATTTSIIAGLISVELLKYMAIITSETLYDEKNYIKLFKSWFVNLANNIIISSEPIKAPMLKLGNTTVNSWTKFEEHNDMILSNFIKKYEQQFKITISMILHGNSIIYANFIPCTENNSLLSSIFKDKYKKDLFLSTQEIIISSEDTSIELPTIQLKL